jgi:hypothetical protein
MMFANKYSKKLQLFIITFFKTKSNNMAATRNFSSVFRGWAMTLEPQDTNTVPKKC